MAFHFSLEAVLKLRASFERLEQNRLLLIAAALVRVREALASLARDFAEAEKQTLAKLAAGIFSAELDFDRRIQQNFRERRAALERREAELLAKLATQQRAYQDAKNRREILEELRDRRLAQYRSEQQRREQQRLDELFLLRRGALATAAAEAADDDDSTGASGNSE
jgi:flagellar export protein FliJ